MEKDPARSRRRALERLKNYRELSRSPEEQAPSRAFRAQPPLEPGEELFGFYDNLSGLTEERIFITDRGLHIFRGIKWLSIRYDAILSIGIPAQCDTNNPNALEAILAEAGSAILPVRGSGEGGPDSLLFKRYLEDVSRDALWRNFEAELTGARGGIPRAS